MEVTVVEDPIVGAHSFEVIERKGYGHPDTLSDALAEALSRRYANYTRDTFGAVLHHNFDKVGLLGGRSEVAFGAGRLTSPIRVLLNGRASESFGGDSIPVRDMLVETARAFMAERLSKIDPDRDLSFQDNLSTGSSPGHVKTRIQTAGSRAHWFAPRDRDDLRELRVLASNDTSVGCGYWPYTATEQAVLTVEQRLTQVLNRTSRPWLGTDIKVMACRRNGALDATLCIPQVADHVPDLGAYRDHLEVVRGDVLEWFEELVPGAGTRVWMNTKDNYEGVEPELYLTAIGSAIETGDEGLVGRGNRVNGLIAMCRPYSMEGACGKNPVYHVGKLYSILSFDLARRIHERWNTPAEVWLVGQEGRRLDDPWQVIVRCGAALSKEDIARVTEETLATLPNVTEGLLTGSITPY